MSIIMDEKAKKNRDLDNIYGLEEEILEGNFHKHDDNKQAMYRKIQITDLQGNPTHVMDDVEVKIECIDTPVDSDVSVEEVISDDNQIKDKTSQLQQMGPSTCDALPIKENKRLTFVEAGMKMNSNDNKDNSMTAHKDLKTEFRKQKARLRNKRHREKLAQLKKMKCFNVEHPRQITGKEKLNRRKKELRIVPKKYDSVEVEEETGPNIEPKLEILKYPSMVSTNLDDEKGFLAIHDVDDGAVFVTWEAKSDAKGLCGVMADSSVQCSSILETLLTNGKESNNQIGRPNIDNGLNEKINFQPTNIETDSSCTTRNNYCQRNAWRINGEEANNRDIYRELPNILNLSDELSEYRCRFCRLTCNSKPAIIAHLIEHTGKKLFICSICYFLCLTPNALEMHYTNAHTSRKRRRGKSTISGVPKFDD